MDWVLGPNHIKAKGALGAAKSNLDLNVRAPSLAAFWPTLPGGATVDARIGGTADRHHAEASLSYIPGAGEKSRAEQAKGRTLRSTVQAKIALSGKWGVVTDRSEEHTTELQS